MIINLTHPEKVAYRMTIDPGLSPLDHIPDRYRNRISKSLEKFESSRYTIEDMSLSQDLLARFIPLYNTFIGSKPGQIAADISSVIKRNTDQGREYRMLCLLNEENFIGGEIYSVRENILVAAYKVVPHISEISMKANLSMLIDFEFIKAAHKLGLPEISIGKDENGYGRRLSMGLLNYKLGFGYRIIVTGNPLKVNSSLELNPDEDYALISCDADGREVTAVNLFLATDIAEFKSRFPEMFYYDKLPVVIKDMGIAV
jgi:hypothetical protein